MKLWKKARNKDIKELKQEYRHQEKKIAEERIL